MALLPQSSDVHQGSPRLTGRVLVRVERGDATRDGTGTDT